MTIGKAAEGKPRHECHKTENWEQSQQALYDARRHFIDAVHEYSAAAGSDG